MSHKWTPDFEVTKPRPGAATKDKSKPPTGQWIGEYVTEIRYRGDGQQAVDPAPQQGFRKELPNPSKPNYATSEYDPADEPTQA